MPPEGGVIDQTDGRRGPKSSPGRQDGMERDRGKVATITGALPVEGVVKLGGPRHSVERGHGSLKRDMARAASLMRAAPPTGERPTRRGT
jgi:hypothetical protein